VRDHFGMVSNFGLICFISSIARISFNSCYLKSFWKHTARGKIKSKQKISGDFGHFFTPGLKFFQKYQSTCDSTFLHQTAMTSLFASNASQERPGRLRENTPSSGDALSRISSSNTSDESVTSLLAPARRRRESRTEKSPGKQGPVRSLCWRD
jgi:hypothetical protein